MGERFERFKARVNNQPEPQPEECNIQTVTEEMHDIFHEIFEIVNEDMTNERWTELIESADEAEQTFPEDFTIAEVGVCLFLMLKKYKDVMSEDYDPEM